MFNSKWTYIDFLMYLLPGGYAVLAFGVALWSINALPMEFLEHGAITGLLVAVLAFVVGNLVQSHSHGGAEQRLKNKYWAGRYPSEIMLYRDNVILSEPAREQYLNALEKLGVPMSRSDFSGKTPEDAKGRLPSQDVFDYVRVALQTTPYADRIRGAEGYYLLFRGLYLVGFWSMVLFGTTLAVNGTRWMEIDVLSWLGSPPSSATAIAVSAIGVTLGAAMWRQFRSRCRGVAVGFVREVQRAAVAAANIALPKPTKQ